MVITIYLTAKRKYAIIAYTAHFRFLTGVARILIGGEGGKSQILCNDVIRNFRKRNFLWDKDIVEWEIENCSLVWHANRILLKREDLNQKSKSRDAGCKLVSLKRITDGVWGRSPQPHKRSQGGLPPQLKCHL